MLSRTSQDIQEKNLKTQSSIAWNSIQLGDAFVIAIATANGLIGIIPISGIELLVPFDHSSEILHDVIIVDPYTIEILFAISGV